MFWVDLLVAAARLEAAGRPEIAARLYAGVRDHAPRGLDTATASALGARADTRLRALTGGGSFGDQFEGSLRTLARETLNPTMFVGMGTASVAFRLTRLASLARFTAASRPLGAAGLWGRRIGASLLAYTAEALSFPIATRLAASALGRELDWSGHRLGEEFASSFILLGALRLTSTVGAGGLRALAKPNGAGLRGMALGTAQQGLLFGGIVLAGFAEAAAGIHNPHPEQNRWLAALGTLLQFNVAGHAAGSLFGPRFRNWESRLDRHIENLSRDFQRPQAGSGIGLEPVLALAGSPPTPLPPRPELPARRLHTLHMVGLPSSGPPSRPHLVSSLKRLSQIEDPQLVDTALRLFYVGTITPQAIRSKVFDAIVRIREGSPIGAEVESLYRDNRLKGARFYSNKIQDLFNTHISEYLDTPIEANGGRNDRRLKSETGRVLKNNFEPLNQNEDRLSLNIQRFNELNRIGRSKERTLSAQRALLEMQNLGESFVENILKAIQDANLDFLTGLNNRRGLDRLRPKVEQRLLGLRRFTDEQKLPDEVLMIDIDFFKKVNDTYGHEAGDAILRSVGGILRDGVRERDIKVRYGGEEFCFVLAKAGREGALMVAEKLRRAVAATPFELPGEAEPIRVTISIGIAELRALPLRPPKNIPIGSTVEPSFTIQGSLDNAVRRADEALYDAKQGGRNRVMVSEK